MLTNEQRAVLVEIVTQEQLDIIPLGHEAGTLDVFMTLYEVKKPKSGNSYTAIRIARMAATLADTLLEIQKMQNIERLAAIEHEQWIYWSKAIADEVSPERRARWERHWIPYEELEEDVKEHDRVWARKVATLTNMEGEQ